MLLLLPWTMPLSLSVSLLMVNTPLLLTRCRFSIFLLVSYCPDCIVPSVGWLALLHCLLFICLVLSGRVFIAYREPFSLAQPFSDGGSNLLSLKILKISTSANGGPYGKHVCRVTFKHLTKPLRSHIRSSGTLGQLLKIPPFSAHSAGERGVPEYFFWLESFYFFELGDHEIF